jgi:release factor glutamine methyltransferase
MDAPSRRTVLLDGLTFAFDDRVLEPRAWTLLQSRWAAELAADAPPGPLLELFAGVGHIGLVASRACGRPLVQVDANPAACELARVNADAAGPGPAVEVRCARVEEALGPDERFPIVLADPPYLPTAEVGDFPGDPVIAVDGGVDGLDLARACLAVVATALAPGGRALLQLRGAAQVEALRPHLPEGMTTGEVREDGPERAVVLLEAPGPAARRG